MLRSEEFKVKGDDGLLVKSIIKKKTYHDSVKLMLISSEAKAVDGIKQAVAVMGTRLNKASLSISGLLSDEAALASPDDLVIAVQGENQEAVEQALAVIEKSLTFQEQKNEKKEKSSPRSIKTALDILPGANLAIISVPGEYAFNEALKALMSGLNVHLFSDNVTIEDEIRLKKIGRSKGLLVMGPDCGTSIINNTPVCFANVIEIGPIGIIGASGTGIQQVTVIIDKMGSGISHAIGTGGRDLSDEVGGITSLMALDALDKDPDTKVILIVSKPPGVETSRLILEKVKECSKPVVVAFLGVSSAILDNTNNYTASTLEEAAAKAVALAKNQSPTEASVAFQREDDSILLNEQAKDKNCKQKYIRGLYTGGSLADEAIKVLGNYVGTVFSNVSNDPEYSLKGSAKSTGNCVIDLGEDEFTRGRPHPMIDPAYRAERLIEEYCDIEVAVILCDIVIGYGSHENPALPIAEAVKKAREKTSNKVTVIASVCGTEKDPQGLTKQEEILRQQGILVFPSNAYAAEVAGRLAYLCAERGES